VRAHPKPQIGIVLIEPFEKIRLEDRHQDFDEDQGKTKNDKNLEEGFGEPGK
jgi:hypothetical protein